MYITNNGDEDGTLEYDSDITTDRENLGAKVNEIMCNIFVSIVAFYTNTVRCNSGTSMSKQKLRKLNYTP